MGLIFFVYSANRPRKLMFQKAAPVRPSETAQKSIDLIFQKKIYQEMNGQDSFQSLTLIEFGIKIWLQSSSKHRWDFYLCHLCTMHIVSSKVNYVRALLVRSQNVAEISKSRRKIWSSWQIFGYMQANKSYFIHLDPSTQSAILSKQLVSMFELEWRLRIYFNY